MVNQNSGQDVFWVALKCHLKIKFLPLWWKGFRIKIYVIYIIGVTRHSCTYWYTWTRIFVQLISRRLWLVYFYDVIIVQKLPVHAQDSKMNVSTSNSNSHTLPNNINYPIRSHLFVQLSCLQEERIFCCSKISNDKGIVW